MDEPSRELTLTKGMPEDMAYPYVDRIKGSLDEAKKYVKEKRGYLERDLSKMFTRTRICDLPKDCAEYPDRYLKPGDAIRCEFTVGHHEGIYIGNKEVIHVSSHLDGKDASKCKEDACARVGKLVPNFVHSPNDRIQILIYRIRVRTYDQIINEAKKYAENKYGLGEYGLLSKNCQHFASLCAIGKERLSDQEFIRYMLTVDKDYERAAALVGV
uniref:LRAT domain-containing protein n=1 Tax=Acrobeloides nanus TaxID=290746 RepID=A0A914DWB5_9BILA